MLKLNWSKEVKMIKNKNRIVLANVKTGNWMKISEECFDILNNAIDNNMSVEQLFNEFEDQNDIKYFKELLEKISELGAFYSEKKEEKKSIHQVYILLTHRCNLNCIHCSMNAKQSNENEYLSTYEVKKALDNIIKLNPKQIVLSGGEPMVRKDFFDILEYLSSNFDGEITLMTNGTLINNENVDKLTRLINSVDLSVDGVDEKTCSTVRGDGVFTKVLNTISILQEAGFYKISLSMVFGNYNYHLFPKFHKLNNELKTKPVPRAFSPIGRGKDSADTFNQVICKEVNNYKIEDMRKSLKACNCKGCKDEICVDYKGDIYPCVLLIKPKYYLGNIFNDYDLKMIFDESKMKFLPGYC